MLSSRSKSGLSDSSNNKTAPTTPRISKLSRPGSTKSEAGSPSPLQKPRFSIDRSPKSVDSKPSVERQSPKISTPPDKQLRVSKGVELQAQLGAIQDGLRKTKEQLASVEQEKTRALEELKDAKKLVDETNEKLKEALAAQKRAEESLEIEKFRADETEQSGIEASQKREEEWQKELEGVRNQHAADVAALLSTSQELQKVRHELHAIIDAKNTALSHADDAMRIAEINAEKVGVLSNEINRLKSLLDSKLENVNIETVEQVRELESEIDALRHELEKLKAAEEKLVEMEALIEGLRVEVADAKTAELDTGKLLDECKKKAEFLEVQVEEARQSEKSSLESLASVTRQLEENNASLQDAKRLELDTSKLLDEWKKKAELLEVQVEGARQSEKSSLESLALIARQLEESNASLEDAKRAELDMSELLDEWKKRVEILEVQLEEARQSAKSSSESLASVTRQLEESNALLQDAESETAVHRGKVASLEIEVSKYRGGLEDSIQHLDVARKEVLEMEKAHEALKSDFQALEEEKLEALSNEKAAASSIETLSEERNKLANELEITRKESEEVKKAMEDLASALQEVSRDAREAQERLLTKQAESEDAQDQIQQLSLALKNTEDNYKAMLEEARSENICIKESIERIETAASDSRAEWDVKELNLLSVIKISEEEIVDLKAQMDKVVELLKEAEQESKVAKEEVVASLRQAESKITAANEAAEEAKAEVLLLKERLLDKENELQNITQENDELRTREAAAITKVNELSALLAEASKLSEENGELSIIDENCDLLPSSTKTLAEAGDKKEAEKLKSEDHKTRAENRNGNGNGNGNGHGHVGTGEFVKPEVKMQESCKVVEDLSSEMDHEEESVDSELDSKMETNSFDQINRSQSDNIGDATISPAKQQQKKKKALLQKFGSLLKKKGSLK